MSLDSIMLWVILEIQTLKKKKLQTANVVSCYW